jgi:hypothetical protein
MVSLIEELEAREAAARVRVEELEANIAELTARLEGEREVWSRLRVTLEMVAQVLGELSGQDVVETATPRESAAPETQVEPEVRVVGAIMVIEAVRGSYDQATAALEGRCGKVLGKRQAEGLVVDASVDVEDFYRCTIPLPSTAATTLVMQVDGKGVVMRPEALRPATLKAHLNSQRALRTRLAPGEKPHRKRMATLACVFDAEPAPRRPHDVIAPPEAATPLPGRPAPGRERTASGSPLPWSIHPSRSSPPRSIRPPRVTGIICATGSSWSTAPATNSA